jgi:glycerate kinase
MAGALGVRLLGAAGRGIGPGGGALAKLERIEMAEIDGRLEGATIDVACDVDSPLLGPRGAARVFAPQKGATPEMVETLERNLARLAEVIRRDLEVDVAGLPGAGAAGGLGAGLVAFLGARLRSGVELVLEAVGLEAKLEGADLAVTGEGRLDGQTAHGKAPMGVAKLAAANGVPVVAVAGCLGEGVEAVRAIGIADYETATPAGMPFEEARRRARALVAEAAERIGRRFAGR